MPWVLIAHVGQWPETHPAPGAGLASFPLASLKTVVNQNQCFLLAEKKIRTAFLETLRKNTVVQNIKNTKAKVI